MKKMFFLLSLLLQTITVNSQDTTVVNLKKNASININNEATDSIPRSWNKGAKFNVNLNQGSLSNWSAGGERFSFSINAFSNLFAFFKKEKNSWDNTLDLAYGIVQTTSLGRRKSNDRIDLVSKYGYALNSKLNTAILFNGRSQFSNGYAYTKTKSGTDTSTLTSKTFTPAYLLLSAGLDYKPKDNFSLMISPITTRWILVKDKLLGFLYGIPSGKAVKSEWGAFLSVNYLTSFAKKFNYKSKIDLFSNYKSSPENIDIFWTNSLSAGITKYINFTFNIDMIYDDNTNNTDAAKGPAPQWLQLMGIGFSYKLGKN